MRNAIRLAAVSALLLATLPARADNGPPVHPSAANDVFVPSLWDPAQAPAKPGLAAVTSLRIITGQDDPPFDMPNPDGDPSRSGGGAGPSTEAPSGFNVDLARAICDELKVACTVQARRWDTIVPALQAGVGDAAVASQSITPVAMREVDFTSPYYRTPARFVARLGSRRVDALPDTIAGQKVGVVAGTAHAAYLQAFFPQAVLVPYGSIADMRAALRDGAIDLAFGDGIAWSQWLNGPVGSACCTFVGGPFTETYFFGDGAGIAVKKGRDDLRRAIDYALWRLAADGTYADLWLKYFPIAPY